MPQAPVEAPAERAARAEQAPDEAEAEPSPSQPGVRPGGQSVMTK
ncbi:hypothetical protein OG976_01100 [Mycobacterium sp. NBC_00419]